MLQIKTVQIFILSMEVLQAGEAEDILRKIL